MMKDSQSMTPEAPRCDKNFVTSHWASYIFASVAFASALAAASRRSL